MVSVSCEMVLLPYILNDFKWLVTWKLEPIILYYDNNIS